jgi:pyrimidine deaminase RibD-like protein
VSRAGESDRRWLTEAIELASCSPISTEAFSVGALIVGADGDVVATGYSRETEPRVHAEESALAKLAPDDPRLRSATMYSSLEPCSVRASRRPSCTALILRAGIPRIVFAWREPPIFVDCEGAELLTAAGRTVIEIPDLAPLARATNLHIPGVAPPAGTGG